MSEGLERWIDRAVGEVREVRVKDGRPVGIRILRDSDAGRRARLGETYFGRVRSIDAARRGAFIDLGLKDEQGFLPLDARGQARIGRKTSKPLTEGAAVVAAVVREAARGKSPVVSLLELSRDDGGPARLAQPAEDLALAAAQAADSGRRGEIDAVIEAGLARTVPVPGGGALTIEPTAALVAIDVDAGGRQGSKDPERFALELNLAAAAEAVRQLRLRGLGGLVAIDFVSLRQASSRKALEQAMRAAAGQDPWGLRTAPLSPFGIIEASRGQLHTPLHERLRDRDGFASAETAALAVLRAIEREARVARGRAVVARVAPEVNAWLEAGVIPWRDALSQRIGVRWSIEASPGLTRAHLDVRTV